MQELIKKFLLVQKEIKNPQLNKVNPFFKSRYADLPSILDMIKPILSKNELFLTQVHKPETDGIIVETIIYHISGEKLESSLFLPVKDKTPQGYGSSITYARRYSILSMLGISADEDDDGNIDNKPVDKKVEKTEKPIEKKERKDPMIMSLAELQEEKKKALGYLALEQKDIELLHSKAETLPEQIKALRDLATKKASNLYYSVESYFTKKNIDLVKNSFEGSE